MFDIRQLVPNIMKGKFINYDMQNRECLQLEDLSNYEVNYDINKIESFSKTPIYVRSSDTQINAIDISDIRGIYECNVCFNYISYLILYSPIHDGIIFINKNNI